MSTLSLSDTARRRAISGRRSRRPDRFSLQCEPLEPRQLLSVFPGGSASAAVLNPPVVQPNVSMGPPGIGDASPTGLSPSQVLNAYGVNEISFKGGLITGNGQGQTIAIVDAYYDPNISSDLAKFDSQYQISAPPTFTQYVTPGLRQDNAGWALETSLDVEWAHAIAPAASILLVESQADLTDLLNAVTYATNQSGVSVVSMSWGQSEFKGETSDDSVFTTPANHIGGGGIAGGITFVASSGDSGSSGAPEYPSASPNVLAVGGTTLNVTKQGGYISESGWNDSGGGYSSQEPEPSYQTAALSASKLKSGHRTTPDVSWDANPSTGVSVYDSVRYDGQSGWFTVGGTSVGAPSWAGLVAITDQGLSVNGVGSLSNAQASVYQLPASDFHDITTGSNGFRAGPGYDLVTGIGTPVANQLVPDLVTLNTPAISTPVSPGVIQKNSASVSTHGGVNPSFTIPTTTFDGGGIGSSTASTATSTNSVSITALNPNTTSTTVTWTVAPVMLVPAPPPPPLVTHMGSSTAPVTAQVSIAISLMEEQPTSFTHFGQSLDNERGKLFEERVDTKSRRSSWIDIVEPSQAPLPTDAPNGEKAPPPAPGQAQPLPVLSPAAVDAVLELFDISELTGSVNRSSSRANQRPDEDKPAWNLSALFGAAVAVVGGYRVAIHGSDRLSGRWLPTRARTRRWFR